MLDPVDELLVLTLSVNLSHPHEHCPFVLLDLESGQLVSHILLLVHKLDDVTESCSLSLVPCWHLVGKTIAWLVV